MNRCLLSFSICLTAFYCLLGAPSHAQVKRCLTDELHQQRMHKHPLMDMENFTHWLRKQGSATRSAQSGTQTFSIPTVIHIVHNGEEVGEGSNISYEQVLSQLHVLNQDFNRRNADGTQTPEVFASLAANFRLSFKLVALDFNGNIMEEPGVNRIEGSRTSWNFNALENDLIPTTQWDASRYLNIWVINFADRDFLGYAYYPVVPEVEGLGPGSGLEQGNEQYDGVVINYEAFGTNRDTERFDLRNPYHLGRTTTHEVGHWLGLLHPWGISFSCSTDDYCNDTPLVSRSNSSTNAPCTFPGTAACQEDEIFDFAMFQNFMDYTADTCMNLFTQEQHMRAADVLRFAPRRSTVNQNSPATPLSLQLDQQGDQLLLSWDTSPTPGVTYVLERSANSYDFEIISIQGGRNYTDTVDANEQEQYFYRVYATNTEGYSPSSNIANVDQLLPPSPVAVAPESPLASEVIVYPNPSNTGDLYVQSSTFCGSNCLIELYNMNGQRVFSEVSQSMADGLLNQKIDVSSLYPGTYILRISDAQGEVYKKVILNF